MTSDAASSVAAIGTEVEAEENSKQISPPEILVHRTPLPGIKLPKTKQEWEEANLFFALNSV